MPRPTGDRASFEALFEQHYSRIYRHVYGLVRNRGDAEDLTQETFLRAHDRLSTLREPAALGAWLYRIATRVCYDFLRAPSNRGAAGRAGQFGGTVGVEEAIVVASDARSVEEVAAMAEMSACGEEFLEKLPQAYRTVIVLHDLFGLTSVEIARRLHCTPGTVKIRLHRARARFKAALTESCEFYRNERGVLVGGRKPKR